MPTSKYNTITMQVVDIQIGCDIIGLPTYHRLVFPVQSKPKRRPRKR